MCSKMSNENGQTLMELIVVILISVLVIGALVFATIASLRNAQFAKNQAQATKLAQEGLERVKVIRERDEVGKIVYTIPPGANQFSDLWGITLTCPDNCYFVFDASGRLSSTVASAFEQIASSDHRRQVTLEDGSDGQFEKKVTIIVEWTDHAGDHQSRLESILSRL